MFGFNGTYKNHLYLLGFCLVVSLALQIFLPHPFGIFTALGIFFTFPFLLRKMAATKYGGFANRFGNYSQEPQITKTCMTCGKKTNKRVCSRCGSKSFRYS